MGIKKQNTCTLVLETQVTSYIAIEGNCVEIPKKQPDLSHDPAISLLDKYIPKKFKHNVSTDKFTIMFIVSLFSIAKTGINKGVRHHMNGLGNCGIYIQ